MLARTSTTRYSLLLAAVALIAMAAFRAQLATAQAGGASITTDKQQYQVGDTIRICYTVPGPGPVVITDISADGRRTVLLSGQDDGTGGCISGTIAPPTGRECERLDYQGYPSQSVQTCFQVVGSSSVGSGARPSGSPCADPANNCPNSCGLVTYPGGPADPCNPGPTSRGPCADPANRCTTPSTPSQPVPPSTRPPAGLSLTTDQGRYQIGDPITICYGVPGPGHVVITDVSADGSSQVLLSGDDDGTGGCLSGTIQPPTGTECETMVYSDRYGRSSSIQTCFQVVGQSSQPSSTSSCSQASQGGPAISVVPSAAAHGQTVIVCGQGFAGPGNPHGMPVTFFLDNPGGDPRRVDFRIADITCTETNSLDPNFQFVCGSGARSDNRVIAALDGTFMAPLVIPNRAGSGPQRLCAFSTVGNDPATGATCTNFTVN